MESDGVDVLECSLSGAPFPLWKSEFSALSPIMILWKVTAVFESVAGDFD